MLRLTLVAACALCGSSALRVGARARSSPRMALTDQEERVAAAMEIKPAKSSSARAQGLALALDEGTRKSHSLAENTAFVTGFFRGIATRDSFAALVSALYFVYEAMETAFDQTADERVKALDYAELRRAESLRADMRYYFGDEWQSRVTPSAATQRYVERVRRIARDEPELLIAHQYTRYLGDLFGGQMMGGMARRSLGLADAKGTQFYTFDAIPTPADFIETWYAQLNSLELSEAQKERIVDEGNAVFALNIEIFEELEGSAVRGAWALLVDAVRGLFKRKASVDSN